jgi:hypothetical protein
MQVSGQLHDPAALPPGRAPGTRWTGGWVGPEPVWTQWCREKYPDKGGGVVINLQLAPVSVGHDDIRYWYCLDEWIEHTVRNGETIISWNSCRHLGKGKNQKNNVHINLRGTWRGKWIWLVQDRFQLQVFVRQRWSFRIYKLGRYLTSWITVSQERLCTWSQLSIQAVIHWLISGGFWRWCVSIERIVLLDFIHRLVSQKLRN